MKELFNEFQQQIDTSLSERWQQYIRESAESYLEYLYKTETPLKTVTEQDFKKYQEYIFESRDDRGLFYSAKWQARHFKFLKVFFKWAVSKEYADTDCLANFSKQKYIEEITLLIEKRRRNLFQTKTGNYNNQTLKELFFKHLENYDRRIKRVSLKTRTILEEFYHFAEKKHKNFTAFKAKDIHEIIQYLTCYEPIPLKESGKAIILTYITAVKDFYKWLYQKGYCEKYLFEEINDREIHAIIEETLIKKKEISERKRYYNIKEILRAYKEYLQSVYSTYNDMLKYYDALKSFIRFSATVKKTVYTADAITIEEYKKYLFNACYNRGQFDRQYHSINWQAGNLLRLKRFYDWFCIKGYRKDHPLKDFKYGSYKNEIIKASRERKNKLSESVQIPDEFNKIFEGFKVYELNLCLTEYIRKSHQRGLIFFFNYLRERNILDINLVEENVLNEYQIFLNNYRQPDGKHFSVNSKTRYLIPIKRLFEYLDRFRLILRDPSRCIMIPKQYGGLPTAGMTHREVMKMIYTQSSNTTTSILNRTILEVLYSSGIRSNELRNLRLSDINFDDEMIRINNPKGGIRYQRIIPIGEAACFWLKRYIAEVRNKFESLKTDILFLNNNGEMFTKMGILNIVKTAHLKSGLRKKKIVTHSMRVTCATEMLKGKCNLRYIQEQLGHTDIKNTARYLRLVPFDLKIAHSKSHPREKYIQLKKKKSRRILQQNF